MWQPINTFLKKAMIVMFHYHTCLVSLIDHLINSVRHEISKNIIMTSDERWRHENDTLIFISEMNNNLQNGDAEFIILRFQDNERRKKEWSAYDTRYDRVIVQKKYTGHFIAMKCLVET